MSAPEDVEHAELGIELLAVVARLHRWATRHAQLPLSLPLSLALARLLAQVEELGPARVGDLARADHSSQPSMTAQVQRLVELGLVHKGPDPDDARAVQIAITDAGRRELAEMRRLRAAAIAPMLDTLSAAERDQVAGAVATLARALAVSRGD